MTGSLVSAATRQRVRGLAMPVAVALGRLGLTPNALTVIGFVGTCVAAFAAADRSWLAAGILVLAFGIFDLLDGTLARATGRASKLGAFLDSTLDRAGEGITYVGIAAGCIAAGFAPGAFLAATALAASFMVSYTRAKAESLGFAPGSGLMNVGLAPREVRLAILAIGLSWAGLWTPFVDPGTCTANPDGGGACVFVLSPNFGSTVLAGTLALMTTLAALTTIQRIIHVRAQAKEG